MHRIQRIQIKHLLHRKHTNAKGADFDNNAKTVKKLPRMPR